MFVRLLTKRGAVYIISSEHWSSGPTVRLNGPSAAGRLEGRRGRITTHNKHQTNGLI